MTVQPLAKDQIQELNKWFIFPEQLNADGTGRFLGYQTRDDITQIRGGFPVGQNIIFTASKTPTVRPGSQLIGTAVVTPHAVKRAWNFERRDGVEIDMKTYDAGVYFRIEGVMTEYELLEGGYTPDLEFGYGVISESADINSRVMFCNGIEDWRKWTGLFAKFVSLNSTDITVDTELSKAAFLTGGVVNANDPAVWAAVNNGSFRVTMDGVVINVDGINFTGSVTMNDIATKIQTALRAVTGKTETVTLTNYYFTITSSLKTTSSAITVLSTSTGTIGQDISGVSSGWMNANAGNGAVTNRTLTGFPETGALSFKGTRITYAGINGYTFTGCFNIPSLASGDLIADYPVQVTGSSILKSSVCCVHDGRLHARNEIKKSVAMYSKLDNPDDWTAGSTDGDGGAKEIEQGGPITAFAHDEKQIYIFKNRLIKTLEYIANNTRIDVPKYATPKPSNDKSTTMGAIGQKSTFAGPNGIFFVTTDKQLIQLYRQDFKDYPQQLDIADPIRPTFFAGVHDEAAGIVYNSKVYYAYKQDSHSSYNDTVIVYDLIRGLWSAPIVGWNVSDWSVISGKLRWHSSVSPDTYELTSDQQDGEFPFTTTLRTWNEIFGLPERQKKADYIMIEIYLQENSEVTATVLYDENGYNGQDEFILKGSDTRFRLGSVNYNPFGASPFGEERFGSNPDVSGMNKYRFFLELKGNVEFYSLALQLSTNTENCNYEFIRFGCHIARLIELLDINYMISPNNNVDNLNI
jgi:hypothetical protein